MPQKALRRAVAWQKTEELRLLRRRWPPLPPPVVCWSNTRRYQGFSAHAAASSLADAAGWLPLHRSIDPPNEQQHFLPMASGASRLEIALGGASPRLPHFRPLCAAAASISAGVVTTPKALFHCLCISHAGATAETFAARRLFATKSHSRVDFSDDVAWRIVVEAWGRATIGVFGGCVRRPVGCWSKGRRPRSRFT
uniref:Uncharacterized protein n=1 Tax=Plectus sambesii TaxID=2011161 RepID=A0A914XFV4_9BILA